MVSFHPESAICHVCSWCESLRDMPIWKRKITRVLFIFTARKRSCWKVMFLHLSVSHSVHGGGVCPSACWDTPPPPPPRQTPPWADTNLPLGRRLLLRMVRILLECILVQLINMTGSSSTLYELTGRLSQNFETARLKDKCFARLYGTLIRRCASRHLEGSNSYRLLSRHL